MSVVVYPGHGETLPLQGTGYEGKVDLILSAGELACQPCHVSTAVAHAAITCMRRVCSLTMRTKRVGPSMPMPHLPSLVVTVRGVVHAQGSARQACFRTGLKVAARWANWAACHGIGRVHGSQLVACLTGTTTCIIVLCPGCACAVHAGAAGGECCGAGGAGLGIPTVPIQVRARRTLQRRLHAKRKAHAPVMSRGMRQCAGMRVSLLGPFIGWLQAVTASMHDVAGPDVSGGLALSYLQVPHAAASVQGGREAG